MKEINERPVCHRAEDLVTYLYDEANEAEARDFANHAEACDACRAELAVFKQVHESISLWRNEALGAAFNTAVLPAPAITGPISIETVRPERRLSALGALRKFFSVSPLWLRAATAFAALMFCVLAVLAISRSWNKPPLASNQPKNNAYSQEQFDTAVANEVKRLMDERKSKNSSASLGPTAATDKPNDKNRPPHLAMNRTQPKVHPRGLSRQERVQLAADLRLIPRDEDELPFVFSEEPNQ